MTRLPLALAAALSWPMLAMAQSYPDARAIVSIGGPVTEIVHALGAGDRMIARDSTSLYPPEVSALPDVGYMRALSAEGVLSVGPDLILSRDTAGPPEVLEQLRHAGVPVVLIHDGFDAAAVPASVRAIGAALGTPEAAADLAQQIEADLEALARDTATIEQPRRVLFILSADGGRLNAAGRDTGADGIITLAGAMNVMAEGYSGYKLVNDEAIIAAAPDVILMLSGRGDHAGRAEEILALPAIVATPAGRAGAFMSTPPESLGFGPRTPELARALHDALYGVGPK